MKINFKSIHNKMKCLVFASMLLTTVNSIAQQRAVILDPKLGEIKMTDLAGNLINENFIQPGQFVKLILPVANADNNAAIPKGSCKIKIGLGSKLLLDPQSNLTIGNASNYFTWSVSNNGGQSQITGELNTALPISFQQVEVAFKVVGNQVGHSTITANFLITNHNTAITLSDNDGNNNASFLKYNITNTAAPTPITSVEMLTKKDCEIKLNFKTDKEINIVNYQVEASKNGIDFVNIFQTNAINSASYNATVAIPASLQSPVIFVRVKSNFISGTFAYSNTKSISGICNDKWKISMYPNPVKGNEDAIIRAIEGNFEGRYTITLVDMVGKVVDSKSVELNNVLNFNYKLGNISVGKYMLKIKSIDGIQSEVLQFEKL